MAQKKETDEVVTGRQTIKEWAEEDRPREKMLLKGWSALSDAELLAILIGTGSGKLTAVDLAKNCLKSADNSLERLGSMSINELTRVKGIGPAKAITIGAAMELGRRRKSLSKPVLPKVHQAEAIYEYLRPYLHDQPVEHLYALLLNRQLEIIRTVHLAKGSTVKLIMDRKLLFKEAMESLASAMVLAHNHPSGSLSPSQADKNLTGTIMQLCQIADIQFLDHVIYTNHGFYSFFDNGDIAQLEQELPKY